MSGKIVAPWTRQQVDALNDYQAAGWMHPFTCGHCRDTLGTDRGHNERRLVATVEGWRCPTCTYTQDWAHGVHGPASSGVVANTPPVVVGVYGPGWMA